MQSSTHRPDPPYRRRVAEIRARILTGELRPGKRMPSIRQISQRWGVAVATATKVTYEDLVKIVSSTQQVGFVPRASYAQVSTVR